MKKIMLPTALLVGAILVGCAAVAKGPDGKMSGRAADRHPAMGNQECLACHQMVSPKVVEEWTASAHGMALVQCGVCHGDEGDFRAAPGADRCIGCHANETATAGAGKSCASCHSAHNYNVHRKSDYAR